MWTRKHLHLTRALSKSLHDKADSHINVEEYNMNISEATDILHSLQ